MERCESNGDCSAPISNASRPPPHLESQVTRKSLTIESSAPNHQIIVPVSLVQNLSPNTPIPASIDPATPPFLFQAHAAVHPSHRLLTPRLSLYLYYTNIPDPLGPANYATSNLGTASTPITPGPVSTHAVSTDPFVACNYATCIEIERDASLLAYVSSDKRSTVAPPTASADHPTSPGVRLP